MGYTTSGRDSERDNDAIKRDYPDLYHITAAVALIGIGIGIGYLLAADRQGLTFNLFTEAIGIAVTVLILDRLLERRAQRRQLEELKGELIREMGSYDNGAVLRAIGELRAHGWLGDGSLRGKDLRRADLHGAELEEADLCQAMLMESNLNQVSFWSAKLQGARFGYADLQDAVLYCADLRGAQLWDADLRHGFLRAANLQGAFLRTAQLHHADLVMADLTEANLLGADLREADLRRANLTDANLEQAKLDAARFDVETVLPDGTPWEPDADLARFTGSERGDLWRSSNPNSPARQRQPVSAK